MRKFRQFLLIAIIALNSTSTFAQDYEFVDPGHMTCGKEHYTEAFFEKHPEQREIAEEARKQLERETMQFSSAKDTEEDLLTIPVVFHIVHFGGSENISDEQVRSAIDVLNEDFSASNEDIGNVVGQFANVVGDVQFEFRLAQKDPQGNCTNGINRVFTELTDDGFEPMKDFTGIWDRSSYLNIWVCRQIGDGVAGYTYIPSTVNGAFGLAYDGIVILHDYVGRIGTSNETRSHALSHEVGHWANLEHTWAPFGNPGSNASCSFDDFVSDTPNTIGWTSCDLGGATCGSLDNVENFMDYSYCYKMFTTGQSNRMRAAMNSNVAQRNQLYTPANLAQTGVLGAGEICFADFQTNEHPVICSGTELTFEDLSFNNVQNRSWTFEGGTPSASSVGQPVIMYNQPGVYSVSLTVSNSQGEESITKNGFVKVIENPEFDLPFEEGFEAYSEIGDNNNWVDVNPDGSNISWQITDQASFTGSQSVHVRGRNNVNSQREFLESPTFDLSDIEENAVLSFRYAHARRNTNSDDQLRVRISRNCGESWNTRSTLDDDELPTVSGFVSGQFIPNSTDDWREVIIENITTSSLTDEFRVRFEFRSIDGNNVFIDDINIFDPNTLSVQDNSVASNIVLFPNPANENVRLRLDIVESQNIQIDIIDASGRVVQNAFAGILTAGMQNIDIRIDRSLPTGLFFVRLIGEEGVAVRKLVVE